MPIQCPSIYEYPSFASYLRGSLEAMRAAGPKYSLRNVARRVGRSPSLLTMVARGDRKVQPELAVEICRVFGVSQTEVQFAEALVNFERARTAQAKAKAADRLRSLKPRNGDLIVELDSFALIAAWHHAALIELTCLESFKEDPVWIATALGPTISSEMAAESLAILQRLGLLKRGSNGKLCKAATTIATKKSASSSAVVRSAHKQIIMRAHRSVDAQSVDERFNSSVTVAIPASLIGEVSSRMLNFRNELQTFLRDHGNKPDTIYHLSMQFFRALALGPDDMNEMAPAFLHSGDGL